MVIITRYAGPTDFQGSRVIATAHDVRKITPWDYALDTHDNHAAAAQALLDAKFSAGGYQITHTEWAGERVGYVHIVH